MNGPGDTSGAVCFLLPFTMLVADFRKQFPEFINVPDVLITAMLTAAALEVDPEVWGVKADQGQAYLAAHKLALSPWGNNARLVARDGSTTYETHYRRLVVQVARGALVT